jgi:sulfate transport system permease protein
MAGAPPPVIARAPGLGPGAAGTNRKALDDPPLIRWLLVGMSLLFLGIFVALPIVTVFVEALR